MYVLKMKKVSVSKYTVAMLAGVYDAKTFLSINFTF